MSTPVNRLFAILLVLIYFSCVAQASGDETNIQLKDGAQASQVRARCSICHSADYIQMNSIFMNKAAWQAEVRKMITVMGAPIPEAEVADIVDYLVRNYGVD